MMPLFNVIRTEGGFAPVIKLWISEIDLPFFNEKFADDMFQSSICAKSTAYARAQRRLIKVIIGKGSIDRVRVVF